MKIELTDTDRKILVRHDSSVRGRALIELAIVDALIQAAEDNLYHLEIEEDDENDASTRYDDREQFKNELFNYDNITVLVFAARERKAFGWIKLTFGNDGWDLISDYSTNLEKFLVPVDKVAKFWGD